MTLLLISLNLDVSFIRSGPTEQRAQRRESGQMFEFKVLVFHKIHWRNSTHSWIGVSLIQSEIWHDLTIDRIPSNLSVWTSFAWKVISPNNCKTALPNTAKDARGSARKSPRGASNRVRGGNAMRVVHPNERLANQSKPFQEHESWYTIHQLIHESNQDLSSCHGSFFSMSLIKYWRYQFVKNDSSHWNSDGQKIVRGNPPRLYGKFGQCRWKALISSAFRNRSEFWKKKSPQLASLYPPTKNYDNGKSTIWRCISHWKWGFSNVMLVFRGVIFWEKSRWLAQNYLNLMLKL